MSLDLLQFDRAKEEDSWRVIYGIVPELQLPNWSEQIGLSNLLVPPIALELGKSFLQLSRRDRTAIFLTDDQLFDIASEAMKPGRANLENDIDSGPGIYIFITIANNRVLKVGQAGDMRERIGKGHLRYGNPHSQSDLIVYFQSKGKAWPQSLHEQDITALLFPIHGSTVADRCIVEIALQETSAPSYAVRESCPSIQSNLPIAFATSSSGTCSRPSLWLTRNFPSRPANCWSGHLRWTFPWSKGRSFRSRKRLPREGPLRIWPMRAFCTPSCPD